MSEKKPSAIVTFINMFMKGLLIIFLAIVGIVAGMGIFDTETTSGTRVFFALLLLVVGFSFYKLSGKSKTSSTTIRRGKTLYAILWTGTELPQDQVIPTLREGATEFATKNPKFAALNSQADVRALTIKIPFYMRSEAGMLTHFQNFLTKEEISSYSLKDIFKFEFKGSTGDDILAWCYFR